MAKVKITDSEVIKSGERELLDIIIGDLDWEAIEKIVKEKHQLRIQDDVEFKQGDIVVYDNTVAYKLDFDVKVTLTVLFDRAGNYLSFSTSGDFTGESVAPESEIVEPETEAESTTDEEEEVTLQEDEALPEENAQQEEPSAPEESLSSHESVLPHSPNPENSPDENMSGMAFQIAEMLAEINEEDED